MTQEEKPTSSFEDQIDFMEAFLRSGGMVTMAEFQQIDTEQKAALVAASNRIRLDELNQVAELIGQTIAGLFNGNEQENATSGD